MTETGDDTTDESTDPAPIAARATNAGQRVRREAEALPVSAVLIYYTVVAAAYLGSVIGFLAIPFPRTMLAGLLLAGIVVDRFVGPGDPRPVVVGYTVLALAVVGVATETLNMPLPRTTVAGALLALLVVDYFTTDRT